MLKFITVLLAGLSIAANLNALGGDLSVLPFATFSNYWAAVQAGLADKAVTAIVCKSRIAVQGIASTTPLGSLEVRQFNVAIGFYNWGYAAQETLITNGAIIPGIILANYSLRSNNVVINATASANPSSVQAELKGKSMEVDVRSNSISSFLFPPLTVWNLSSLVSKLDDVSVTPSTNAQSQQLFIIDGILNEDGQTKREFRLTIDPLHQMFPVEGEIYRYGELLNKWHAEYSQPVETNYFPDVLTVEVFKGSAIVWSEIYSNITVKAQSEISTNFVNSGFVANGSIVNEHRFARAFSYVEGARPPTPKELSAMASSDSAIMEYQHSALIVGPFRHAGTQLHGRLLVVAAMLFLTVAACVYLLFAARRAKN